MTRPDRTQFFYDCEGFPTAVVDRNGNEADFTYTARQSELDFRSFRRVARVGVTAVVRLLGAWRWP
jgi:hypothetical protein